MSSVSEKRFSAAVIGAGFISDYHVRGIQQVPGASVSTLVGLDPVETTQRAERLGVKITEADMERVLRDPAIDGVVIATPDRYHRDHAIAALEAGKPVLLQKPMALTLSDCRDIIATADRTGTPLTVSFMHRYFPEVRWLRQLLAEGKLGKIHMVRMRNATPGADWAGWFFDPANVSGGVVMQVGIHGIDLVMHLFGQIETVASGMIAAQSARVLKDGTRVSSTLEDNVLARYRLASGVLVTHEMSYTERAGCDRFRMEVYSDAGTVWLRTERGAAAVYAPDVTGEDAWITPDLPNEPMGREHHAHWISVAERRVKSDDTALSGARAMAVAEAIYQADGKGEIRPQDVMADEKGTV